VFTRKELLLARADFPVCLRIDGTKSEGVVSERCVPDTDYQAFDSESNCPAFRVLVARAQAQIANSGAIPRHVAVQDPGQFLAVASDAFDPVI